MECNFDDIFNRGIIKTIYHDLDIRDQDNFGDTIPLLFGSSSFFSSMLWNNDRCIWSILQTCRPPGDYVANITENTGFSCPAVRTYSVYPDEWWSVNCT